MQMRASPQGRALFDAIIKANSQETEEFAIWELARVAGENIDTSKNDKISIADLHNTLFDNQNDYMTVLMTAVKAGNIRIIKSIIDLITFFHETCRHETIDFNITDINGNTALMHAASSGNMEIVKLLMATGKCDPSCKNNHNKTAAELAGNANHYEIEILLTHLSREIDTRRSAKLLAHMKMLKFAGANMKKQPNTEPVFKKPKSIK